MARKRNRFRFKLLIQENSQLKNLSVFTDGSVTKDQSGWGSLSSKVQSPSTKTMQPIKYKLSTSSLLMGGGCSYACSPLDCFKIQRSNKLTTHAIVLKESMSLQQHQKVEWEAQISMCQYSTFTFKVSSFYHVNALFWTCQSQEK